MTYNNTSGVIEYGACPYIAHYNTTTTFGDVFSIQLPVNVSLLKIFKTLKRCLQTTRPNSEAEADVEAESDTDSLPDRLINPGEYEPVLPTTEEHKSDGLTEDKQEDSEEPRRLILVYTYGSIN